MKLPPSPSVSSLLFAGFLATIGWLIFWEPVGHHAPAAAGAGLSRSSRSSGASRRGFDRRARAGSRGGGTSRSGR